MKNSSWYLIGIAFLLLGELVIVVTTLTGNPPEFSSDHRRTLIAFSIAAGCSLIFLLALGKISVRPIYWLCLAAIAFSAAGFASGYNWKICAMLGISGGLIMSLAGLFGDSGDTNSAKLTIRIRLPWR